MKTIFIERCDLSQYFRCATVEAESKRALSKFQYKIIKEHTCGAMLFEAAANQARLAAAKTGLKIMYPDAFGNIHELEKIK